MGVSCSLCGVVYEMGCRGEEVVLCGYICFGSVEGCGVLG